MKRSLAVSIATATAAVATFATTAASADPLETEAGAKGTLSIDQLSGFRVSSIDGLSYAGPLGFSVQRTGIDFPVAGVTTTSVLHKTSFWVAPSVDYFVIDHLSIGGLIEISTTSSSQDTVGKTTTTTQNFPAATNITLLPRIGYLIPVGERFAIWPRAGIGYFSHQDPATLNQGSTSGAIFDADVGFLYRLTNAVFLRAAPEFSVALGANSTITTTAPTGATTTSASLPTGYYNFSGTLGIGVFLHP